MKYIFPFNFYKSQRPLRLKLAFAMFSGLFVSALRYLFFPFKFFRVFFLFFIRNLKKFFVFYYFKFLNFLALSSSEFQDCFFFSSIALLFFRFFFRLFFINPYWYFNFFIYVFAFFIQKQYKPLDKIRIFTLRSLRIFLGKQYWYTFSIEISTNYFSKEKELPIINIFKGNLFHLFFRNVFVFFILFRLFILKNTLKFIFFNFFLHFLLIFNHFFLFSSFFSLFLLISKLCFFSTEHNTTDFFSIISEIEKFNPKKDYIVPNWKNAKIISLIIARSFCDINFPNFITSCSGSVFNLYIFYDKYIQYEPEFFEYCYKIDCQGFPITYRFRNNWHENYLKKTKNNFMPIYKILAIKKIKNPKKGVFVSYLKKKGFVTIFFYYYIFYIFVCCFNVKKLWFKKT